MTYLNVAELAKLTVEELQTYVAKLEDENADTIPWRIALAAAKAQVKSREGA